MQLMLCFLYPNKIHLISSYPSSSISWWFQYNNQPKCIGSHTRAYRLLMNWINECEYLWKKNVKDIFNAELHQLVIACHLAPERLKTRRRKYTALFKLKSKISILSVSSEIAPRWMPEDLTDDKSTTGSGYGLVLSDTSHYLSQCWPRSLPPYGVTRPK